MPAFKPPGQCPSCGEWIPRNATSCDCCGACAHNDWKAANSVYDGLDLPGDDDFDYEQFVAEEFGTGGKPKRHLSPLWWWVAVILLLILGYGVLAPIWR